jgi:hypothetical protein
MSVRTLTLAAALTVGIGSAAMAQGVAIETPFGGVAVGVPGPYYDYYDGPAYRGYYYEPQPDGWSGPYGWSRQGDRVDEEIFSGSAGRWALEDDYENQTGINR